MASEYRLTDFRCDVTGELPTRTYNPKLLWEPGGPVPKRAKPLTGAERVRRHRKKQRNGCNAERMNQSDGTVCLNHTLAVTEGVPDEVAPRKTAKNVAPNGPDVTLSVLPSHTLIHLTSGVGQTGNPPSTPTKGEKKARKPVSPFSVTPIKPLAPGHSTCNHPTIPSLPAGWHWCRFEKAVVTDTGIVVPIVDDPLVGTEAQREAHRFLQRWEQARNAQAA